MVVITMKVAIFAVLGIAVLCVILYFFYKKDPDEDDPKVLRKVSEIDPILSELSKLKLVTLYTDENDHSKYLKTGWLPSYQGSTNLDLCGKHKIGSVKLDSATTRVTFHSEEMMGGDEITITTSEENLLNVFASKEGYTEENPFVAKSITLDPVDSYVILFKELFMGNAELMNLRIDQKKTTGIAEEHLMINSISDPGSTVVSTSTDLNAHKIVLHGHCPTNMQCTLFSNNRHTSFGVRSDQAKSELQETHDIKFVPPYSWVGGQRDSDTVWDVKGLNEVGLYNACDSDINSNCVEGVTGREEATTKSMSIVEYGTDTRFAPEDDPLYCKYPTDYEFSSQVGWFDELRDPLLCEGKPWSVTQTTTI